MQTECGGGISLTSSQVATAPRRSSLAHQATDIAVAGARPIKARTGTRRLTRSATVTAARRLSGTIKKRSIADCGPLGQNAGIRAATVSQMTQSDPPTDSGVLSSSIKARRMEREPVEAQGQRDGREVEESGR